MVVVPEIGFDVTYAMVASTNTSNTDIYASYSGVAVAGIIKCSSSISSKTTKTAAKTAAIESVIVLPWLPCMKCD